MDDELAKAEESTLHKLEKVEVHWHWVKVGIIAISCLVTIIVVIFYSNRSITETIRTRRDLNCALLAFVPSNQNYSIVTANIHKCVEENQ